MSNEEMQFADPEWQSPEQRSSTPEQEPFNPQPINAPAGEQPGWQSTPHEESGGESDYFAGYRARQKQQYAVPPRPRQRGRTGRWFWIILTLILLTFFAGRPFFIEGGYLVESFVLKNVFFGLVVLAIVIAVIAMFRSRSR